MSTITLHLPDHLVKEMEKLADKEHVSLEHLVSLAIAEKISASETEAFFLERIGNVDKAEFQRIMAKVPNAVPDGDDSVEGRLKSAD